MHNRKKLDRPPSEAEIAALQKKTQTYGSLVSIIFARRKQQDNSQDTLDLIGKLLRNNPDFYSLWNFRREVLFNMNPSLQEATAENKYSGDNANNIRDEEMNLSADGIRRNPKSCKYSDPWYYRILISISSGLLWFFTTDGAWHHRQWIIGRFDVNFEQELALCKEFLRQDQRNFHCWNYRRFVVAASKMPPDEELNYSAEKVKENFSNYSAFHHRSLYIKHSGKSFVDILPEEFSIVENAIFTEPDDQSAWWYHQFLLTWVSTEVRGKQGEDREQMAAWFVGVLLQQLELIRGLQELEDRCTWVMNCLLRIIDLLTSVAFLPALEAQVQDGGPSAADLLSQRTVLLEKLLEVDPNHRQRYKYLLLRANGSPAGTTTSTTAACV